MRPDLQALLNGSPSGSPTVDSVPNLPEIELEPDSHAEPTLRALAHRELKYPSDINSFWTISPIQKTRRKRADGLGYETRDSVPESAVYLAPESEPGKIRLVAFTHVSPTQVDNYQKCHRLWYFKSILKFPETQKSFQGVGEGVHLIAEMSGRMPWPELPRLGYEYNHSDVPSLDAVGWETAKTLGHMIVPLLPDPSNAKSGAIISREAKIEIPTFPGGPLMIGYVDLGMTPGIGWPSLLIAPEFAVIGDFKTTSDFRYMKTPAELADNTQMMVYAKAALDDLQDPTKTLPGIVSPRSTLGSDKAPVIALAHLYARTKPPFNPAKSIRNSVAYVTEDQINAKWQKTLDTVRAMVKDSQAPDAQQVQPTGVTNNHCTAYGGCAYRDKCGLPAESPIKALFGSNKASQIATPGSPGDTMAGSELLERIKALQAQQAANAGKPAPQGLPPGVPVVHQGAVINGAGLSAPTPGTQRQAIPVVQTPVTPAPAPAKTLTALINQIKAGNAGNQPTIDGLVKILYLKESPGASTVGTGNLVMTVIKSPAELQALADKFPTQAGASGFASGVIPPEAPPRAQDPNTIGPPGTVSAPVEPALPGESVADDDEEAPSPVGETPSPAPGKRGRPTSAETAAKAKAQADALEAEINRRVAERLGSNPALGTGPDPLEMARLQGLANAHETANKGLADSVLKAQAEIAKLKATIQTLGASSGHAPQAQGFVLYVDCGPCKGERVMDYLEWYGPLAAIVAEDKKVADWRQISYTAKGDLAVVMRQVIASGGLPPAMAISANGPGADVALELLIPYAAQVIRRI